MPHTETFVNGVWHPSVTTVMSSKPKPWVVKWAEKWGPLAERKLKITGALGDEVHRCIETYFKTGDYVVQVPFDEDEKRYPSLVKRVEGMMKSFVAWAEKSKGCILFTERKVISRRYKYSGTVD